MKSGIASQRWSAVALLGLAAGAIAEAQTVPGTIEAEDFDAGGEGIGYHDNVIGNAGGLYRVGEDVDIVSSSDPDGGGFDVNNFETGEWLAYTLDVARTGDYELSLRLASAFSNSAVHIEVDGRPVTGRIAVPNTGSWRSYQWLGVGAIPLTAGQHTMRLVADEQYFNLNALRFEAVPDTTPYGGTAIRLPGSFEAEDFDLGGQDMGYRDNVPGNAGGQYRVGEDVDIIASTDGAGVYDVNNFETGEWLAYSVDIAQSGRYDVALRLASGFSDSAFRLEIDGRDVSGRIAVPHTGGWSSYRWVTATGIDLPAGNHELRIVAEREYFNLNTVAVSAALASTPHGGTPFRVPGRREAEDFDYGGQGAGYLDHVPGNAGGQYRTTEDVDIIPSTDTLGGGYVVNHFETGEWLGYTLDVTASADYEVRLRLASGFSNSAFHIEIDGRDVTGTVAVPHTGGWTSYRWIAADLGRLAAGSHQLRVVSDQQYFNLNALEIAPPQAVAGAVPAVNPGQVLLSCTFASSPTDCGFREQAYAPGRATIVNMGRDGSTAVRLETYPSDTNVSGSGSAVRNDLTLSQAETGCYEGAEQWWAHSVLFPDDFISPINGWGVVFDFHQTGSGGGSTGQANFHVDTSRWDGLLHLRGYGGPSGVPRNSDKYEVVLGPVVRNTWYDFVYHVHWSSGPNGYMQAWLNGDMVLDHHGPTLYTGQGCYLKLANYHTQVGAPSAVIHDRVIRGTTPQAVARGRLEGVLEIVNGVLTPVQ